MLSPFGFGAILAVCDPCSFNLLLLVAGLIFILGRWPLQLMSCFIFRQLDCTSVHEQSAVLPAVQDLSSAVPSCKLACEMVPLQYPLSCTT